MGHGDSECAVESKKFPLGHTATLVRVKVNLHRQLPNSRVATALVGIRVEPRHLGWGLGSSRHQDQVRTTPQLCWAVHLPERSRCGPLSYAFGICQGLQSRETQSYLGSCRVMYFFTEEKTRYLCKCQFPTLTLRLQVWRTEGADASLSAL